MNPMDLPEPDDADSRNYYKSPLPVTSIQVLDTAEGVDVFLQHLKAAQMIQSSLNRSVMDYVIVGFDCEWKPMMRYAGYWIIIKINLQL